jgi:hypothetical protein
VIRVPGVFVPRLCCSWIRGARTGGDDHRGAEAAGEGQRRPHGQGPLPRWHVESAFIPFVGFGDLDNNTFKSLTSVLSVE